MLHRVKVAPVKLRGFSDLTGCDTLRVIGYRHTPAGYSAVSLDERDWLWVEPLRIYVAVRNGRVVCYNEAGEEFGEDRLIDLLRKNANTTMSGLLHAILESVKQFGNGRQYDDMTLVGLRCGNFGAC